MTSALYHGKPCPKCGSQVRYTSSGQCIHCAREKAKLQARARTGAQPFTSLWTRHPWLVDMLISYWKSGISTQVMANDFQAELEFRGIHENVNKNCIIGKAHRLGLPSRPSPLHISAPARKLAVLKAVATRRANPRSDLW